MKYLMLLIMLLLATISVADSSSPKHSVGKPRVEAFFMDRDIIRIVQGQLHTANIKIHSSAKILDYVIYSSNGLFLKALDQSSPYNATESILSIPVQMSVSQQGRFYIHVELTTVKDGIETKGVISKVVSSETDINERILKKNTSSKKIHLLPASETIKKKIDE
ncbi:MAG: hypothetical protein IPK77_03700 [Cellvibrio sp.]|jgi:hypothetical protein|nr:hypothetical protein [Cellvibrio sp.]